MAPEAAGRTFKPAVIITGTVLMSLTVVLLVLACRPCHDTTSMHDKRSERGLMHDLVSPVSWCHGSLVLAGKAFVYQEFPGRRQNTLASDLAQATVDGPLTTVMSCATPVSAWVGMSTKLALNEVRGRGRMGRDDGADKGLLTGEGHDEI